MVGAFWTATSDRLCPVWMRQWRRGCRAGHHFLPCLHLEVLTRQLMSRDCLGPRSASCVHPTTIVAWKRTTSSNMPATTSPRQEPEAPSDFLVPQLTGQTSTRLEHPMIPSTRTWPRRIPDCELHCVRRVRARAGRMGPASYTLFPFPSSFVSPPDTQPMDCCRC